MARLPRALAALLVIGCLALAACGGDDGSTTGDGFDADVADVAVIDDWSEALSAGDLDGAAELFALPSIAENGSAAVRLESPAEARLFNTTLPCGVDLIRASTAGEFTTATFRLTERAGAGICGTGTGSEAQVAFVIEEGQIAEWRRVGAGGQRAEGRAS